MRKVPWLTPILRANSACVMYFFALLHILQTGKRLIANEISSRSAEKMFCCKPSMLSKASQIYPDRGLISLLNATLTSSVPGAFFLRKAKGGS
jgi:hypothetical protein